MDLKKRQFQQDECDVDEVLVAPHQHSKRSRREEDNSQQPHHICVFGNLSMLGITNDMIVKVVADSVSRIVYEEVESRLAQIPRQTINETGPSVATKFYKLVFENELSDTIYTFSKIKAKDDEDKLVKIALYDIRTESIVTSGPLSSLKVEICVVKDEIFGGSGGSSDEKNWTTEQFKANILRQMDKTRGMLLRGDSVIQLKNGVGYINKKIMFGDNSGRTRTKHLRLGAIVHSTSREAEVKEAVSNRFRVKDYRGEGNKKRYPPFQNDPIWRLKNISKNGNVYNWLSDELKINTVKQLLHVHETNPSSLQKKYGPKLKEAIKHAKTCILEVAPSHGQNYTPSQQITLNLDDKRLETVKHGAYNNAEGVFFINPASETPSAHSSYPTMPPLVVAGQCSTAPPLHRLPITEHQDQVQKGQDFSQPSTSTSQIGEAIAADINKFGFSPSEIMNMEGNDYYSLLAPHDPTENDFPGIPFAN